MRATLDCISSDGLFNTTFESIGQKIGIGKSHVLYYYPDLEDLLLAALAYAYRTGQDIVTEFMASHTKATLLDRYIDGAFHWIATHPSHGSAAALLLYQATLSGKYRKLQQEVRAIGLERIAGMVSHEKPRWKKARVRESAEAIHALVLGSLVYGAFEDSAAGASRVAASCKTACRRLLS